MYNNQKSMYMTYLVVNFVYSHINIVPFFQILITQKFYIKSYLCSTMRYSDTGSYESDITEDMQEDYDDMSKKKTSPKKDI